MRPAVSSQLKGFDGARDWQRRRDDGLDVDPAFLDQAGGERVITVEAERTDEPDFLANDRVDRNGYFTGDADLNALGGIIVWDPRWVDAGILAELKARFPDLEVQTEIELLLDAPGLREVTRVGLAFVPPRR